MLWKGFQKPKRLAVDTSSLTDKYGIFWAQPFERGFGTTVGNALRRVLLSSIEGAAALYTANGITATATYDTVPLEVEVGIISSFGRRYLEALHLFDRLMPILRTLEIYEVISSRQVDTQRKIHRKAVRGAAVSARELATGMRRRIHELSPTQPRNGGSTALAEPSAETRIPDPSASNTPGNCD